MMCGMVGAGKTTRACEIEAETHAVRLSPDDWITRLMSNRDNRAEANRMRDQIEAIQWEVAQKLLASGADVILENGFWGKGEREERRDVARALGAKVCLHFLNPLEEELWRRLVQRNRVIEVGAFRVTREELNEWIDWFQKPDADEIASYDAY